MYENRTPSQQNGLTFGCKKRYIGAVQGLVQSVMKLFPETFTTTEAQQLQDIMTNAHSRAKTTFEETKRRLESTEANSGPETEHRQYNGK